MIKYLSIVTLLSGILLSEIIPENTDKIEFIANIDSINIVDTSISKITTFEKKTSHKYPGRAMLLSGIIPGLGEIYAGSPLKAFLFAGIEASAWYYKNKAQDEMVIKEIEYKKFADEHWDFGRWVTHYYDYYNYRNDIVSEFKMYKLFSNRPTDPEQVWTSHNPAVMFSEQYSNFNQIEEWIDSNNDGIQDENEIIEWNYTHLNDGSHSIAFFDPRYNEFRAFPNIAPTMESNDYFQCMELNISTLKCNEFGLDSDFEESLDGFYVQKNLHFYENIGKYNQFFMGWDDALFTNEELVLIDNKMNIGSSIENYIISAWSVDLTEPWNPDTTTVIITDEFNYDKNNGELSLNSELDPDLENFQITYTKASIFDNEGYLVPKSPNKWVYRGLRDEYNNIGKFAGYAMTAVMFNHVISMIDAVITTNIYNRKNSQSRISAEPILDTTSKYGVGGIKLKYRF